MGPGSMWSDLARPWQTCLDLAWEAYCEDCYPIGAVVTDAGGQILTRGRNRIYEKNPRRGRLPGNELAHAEVEALRAFPYGSADQHACSLYTTTEPCPMCMGTLYMSGLRTLHFAARDPFAGSADLLGKTWYLSRKPIRVHGPQTPALENLVIAMFVEQDCGFHDGQLPEGEYYQRLAGVVGEGFRSGGGSGSRASCVRFGSGAPRPRRWSTGWVLSLNSRAAFTLAASRPGFLM
jgi:tRNA(Arg) A34 adenosine deaminase TadA